MIVIRKINEIQKGRNFASVWEPDVPSDLFAQGTFILFTTTRQMPELFGLHLPDGLTANGVLVLDDKTEDAIEQTKV